MAHYYIDTGGSDGAAGTSPATAWATIAHAMAVGLVDGDTLSLNGGQTHVGGITIQVASATLGITVNSYGSGKATIAPVDTGGSPENGLIITETSNVLIDNLNFQGSGSTLSGTFPNLHCVPITEASGIAFVTNVDATQFENITIRDCDVDGFLFGILGYAPSATCSVAYRNVLIERCHTTSCINAGIDITANRYNFATPPYLYDNITLRNCSAINTYGQSAAAGGGAVDQVGSAFTFFGFTNSLIYRCYAHGVNGYGPNPFALGAAGFLSAYSSGTIFRECEADNVYSPEQADGVGFDADLLSINTIFERCYGHDCHGEAFMAFTDATGTVFRECVMHRCGQYVDSGGSRGLNVRAFVPITMVHCTTYADGNLASVLTSIRETFGGGGSTYVNNIFRTNNVANGAMFGSIGTPTLMVGNCYSEVAGGGWKFNINSIDYTSLAGLHGAGLETYSAVDYGLDADPQMLNPSVASNEWLISGTPTTFANFDLAGGSPALNTDLDAATLLGLTNVGTTDFHNNPLNSGHGTGFSFGAVSEVVGIVDFIFYQPPRRNHRSVNVAY